MMRTQGVKASQNSSNKLFAWIALLSLAFSFVPTPSVDAGAIITDLNSTDTNTVATHLIGSGVTLNTVSHTGDAQQIGTASFTDGDDVYGIPNGIILSSGNVAHIAGPNELNNTSSNLGQPGDSDLAMLSGVASFDASILNVGFTPTTAVMQVDYVFGSDEYSEYANSSVNDTMAFFVNGVNCSQTPQGTAVSINTINAGNPIGTNPQNADLFNDNSLGSNNYNTEMDGFTDVLTCVAPLQPNQVNTLKVAIGDGGDAIYDSWLVLQGGSLSALDDTDSDGDGTPDTVEDIQGTDPNDNTDSLDNDTDGHPDFVENGSGSDPIDPNSVPQDDADGDGVPDYVEVVQGTNPGDPSDYLDTDGDLVPDYIESVEDTETSSNASYADDDLDTIPDYVEEQITGTDPTLADSDDDGENDADEIGADVYNPLNTDNDSLIDALDSEILDTDGDGTLDEMDDDNIDPCIPDIDAGSCDQDDDGLTNDQEDIANTDKLNPDTDNDTILDGDEISQNSNPLDVCDPDSSADSCDTDGDSILNGNEDTLGTDKSLADTDGDGEDDGAEIADVNDPQDADLDGIIDALESSIVDTDNDSVFDEADPANDDPCIPQITAGMCDQDNDGLTNDQEDTLGTDKSLADTDGDGEDDGAEIADVNNPQDADLDGIIDALESSIVDTDNDSVFDEADPNNADPCTPDPQTGECDLDQDGLSNELEAQLGTDITNPDSDGDGIDDQTEVGLDIENPSDEDQDGIIDALDSSLLDSDGDQVNDQQDGDNNNNCIPNLDTDSCDQDGDGMSNQVEDKVGTDRSLADTDGDGKDDGAEVGSDTDNPLDADLDGIIDALDSAVEDSDNDGEFDEEDASNSDPCSPDVNAGACDQDNDGLTNDEEDALGLNKLLADTDNDGLEDGMEIDQGTNPNLSDTDNDGLEDGEEAQIGSNPLSEDTDSDGISDEQEILNNSNPMSEDDDNDGVPTQVEINAPNNGDNNSDGIPDYTQINVTSKPSEVSGGYTSLVSSGGCDVIDNIQYMAEESLSKEDPVHDYLAGLHDFEVSCSVPGGTAQITVVWDREYDVSNWQYFKFDPRDETYSDISNRVTFSTIEVDGITKTTSSYQVVDGGPLDIDGEVNSKIIDPAGPTVMTIIDGPENLIRSGGASYVSQLLFFLGVMSAVLALVLNSGTVSFIED